MDVNVAESVHFVRRMLYRAGGLVPLPQRSTHLANTKGLKAHHRYHIDHGVRDYDFVSITLSGNAAYNQRRSCIPSVRGSLLTVCHNELCQFALAARTALVTHMHSPERTASQYATKFR